MNFPDATWGESIEAFAADVMPAVLLMAVEFQVTFDAHHPPSLAEFWALALQYIIQPPPPGFDRGTPSSMQLEIPEERREDRAAVVDPPGEGPRVFFQRVPEGKTAKNRVHLDVSISGGRGYRRADPALPDRAACRPAGRCRGHRDRPASRNSGSSGS